MILAKPGSEVTDARPASMTPTHTFFIGKEDKSALFFVVDEEPSLVGTCGVAVMRLPRGSGGEMPRNATEALDAVVRLRAEGSAACAVLEIAARSRDGALTAVKSVLAYTRLLHGQPEDLSDLQHQHQQQQQSAQSSSCCIFFSQVGVISTVARATGASHTINNLFSRKSSKGNDVQITISPAAATNLKQSLGSQYPPIVAAAPPGATSAPDLPADAADGASRGSSRSPESRRQRPLITLRQAANRTRILSLVRRVERLARGDDDPVAQTEDSTAVGAPAPDEAEAAAAAEGTAVVTSRSATAVRVDAADAKPDGNGEVQDAEPNNTRFAPLPEEIVDGTAAWEPQDFAMPPLEAELRVQQMMLSLLVFRICRQKVLAARAKEMAEAERRAAELPILL